MYLRTGRRISLGRLNLEGDAIGLMLPASCDTVTVGLEGTSDVLATGLDTEVEESLIVTSIQRETLTRQVTT